MTTQQDRRLRIEAAYAALPPDRREAQAGGHTFTETRDAGTFGAFLGAMNADVSVERLREILAASFVADKDEAAFLTAYYGSPAAVHFVGFRGNEYISAVRAFGRPDFFHRTHDVRMVRGGELAPHDVVVFANGSENAVRLDAVDDSNIDVQAFEKALTRAKSDTR